MEQELKELEHSYKTYLEKFSGRKQLYSRAMGAIINTNSKTKKFCLIIIRELFENENKPDCLFLNDIEISKKLMFLLKKGINEDIILDKFISEFFSLSKVFQFLYETSKLP